MVLMPKRSGAAGSKKTTTLVSGEGSSKTAALERAAENSLSLLEKELSIRLVDVNYSRRLHAELYASEANKFANLSPLPPRRLSLAT